TWFGFDSQVGGSRSGNPPDAPITFPAAGVKVEGGDKGISPAIEGLSVSGLFSLASGHWGDFNRGDWTLREVVTKVKGPHELIFGGEVVRLIQDISNTNTQSGSFNFSSQFSGSNLADFLLGWATSWNQGAGQYQNVRGAKFSMFIQDNWRVTPSLALNMGLRWDPFFPYTEIYNRVPCWSPGQQSTVYPNAPAGIIYGGDTGCPWGKGANASAGNFAPRFGFAYRVHRNTVIRGGVGVYYVIPPSRIFNGPNSVAPFMPRYLLSGMLRFEDPYGSFGMANPFPAEYVGAAGAQVSNDVKFAVPLQIYGSFSGNYRLTTLGVWNLRVERQFGSDWMVSAAYVGNGVSHLSISGQMNPAVYIPGASTVGNTQTRRLYKDFTSVAETWTDGNAGYHALQLNLEKRFSRGLSLLSNYAWSKKMDNAGTITPFRGRDFNYGRASDDIPHIFHFTALWEVPRSRFQGAMGRILNGWDLSSVTTWQSTAPFTVTSGVDNSFTAVGGDRADFIGTNLNEAKLSGQSHAEMVARYFNTSLFVANKVGTYGNTGKNILRGPRFFNTDVGVIKNTNITEQVRTQFRVEFFNLFNKPNFDAPSSSLTSASFGQITSARDPRILQLTLKLMF
ncbi:MAG TPA: TonB-dependent receptor, partial [Bryobacteraceae bacterium]|nr:TonB-dependent receptor [Bryobacteraceae bacterium]